MQDAASSPQGGALLERPPQSFFNVADATFTFQGQLQRRLREIDRKALNAQVLVKRHGKELAGYGVVAQSFRDGARQLQHNGAQVQRAIYPLMLSFMQALRDATQLGKLLALPPYLQRSMPSLGSTLEQRRNARAEHSLRAGTQLRQALERFSGIVAELEYVVVNANIEAALKGDARMQLAQVSADMKNAVAQVADLLRQYVQHIEQFLP